MNRLEDPTRRHLHYILNSNLQYDYFVKDHLGNVRMLLTEQTQTDAYPDASLETSTLTNEKLYYSGLDTGRVNKAGVSGYPSDPYTSPNDWIQELNGNGAKVGAGIVLKVMTGDTINIRANSWWKSLNSPDPPVSPLTDLASALNNQVGALAGSHGTTSELTSSGVLSTNAGNFLSDQTYNSSLPKAFLNWILFDEQFNYVSSSSGFDQVASSNTFKTHMPGPLRMNKSGYLYIYVSNETPNINVFFDNLQVTHIRGPLLEETHYYPFGLTMTGISSKALAFGAENKYKFNGGNEFQSDEFSDGSGMDLYDAKYRMYDPQIGRFERIDPLADFAPSYSPYIFGSDNPTLRNDPFGLKDTVVNGEPGETKILENVNVSTSKSARLTYALNHSEYGEISSWVDLQMKKYHHSPSQIREWAERNDLIDENTTWNLIKSATSPGAIRIRRAEERSWKLQGKFMKLILIACTAELGGEVVAGLADGGEEASVVEDVADGSEEVDAGVEEEFEETTSVFHKGNLNGGTVSSSRTLSTGLERSSVEALEREGKVWEFKIPTHVLKQWLNGPARTITDLDQATGIINQEIRFSSSLSAELQKYLVQ